MIPVCIEWKWSARDTVSTAELRLRHDLVGSVTIGRLGLGCMTKSGRKTSDTQERRTLTLEDMRKMGRSRDRSKLLHSVSRDNGSSWKEFAKGRSQWNKLLRTEMQSAKFLVRSVLDVLPTPTKLVTWTKHEDTYCCLFGKPVILDHPYLMIILKSTNQWQVPLQS